MPDKRKTALTIALTDSDLQVREAAGAALDQLEGLNELPRLLSQLAKGDRQSRIAAAYALGKIHSSKVFVPLLEALKSTDPDLRTVAANILGEKKHPKTLAPLVKALGDSEAGVVAEVTRALAHFPDPRLPKIFGPLIGREEEIALAAIDSIGKIGFPEGEDALIRALTDNRPGLRMHAAIALGNLRLAD